MIHPPVSVVIDFIYVFYGCCDMKIEFEKQSEKIIRYKNIKDNMQDNKMNNKESKSTGE